VVREYDQFLAYIVEQDLEGVCELKPIVNGGEIMKSLGAKNGPWMSKATAIILDWQLLNPDTSQETALEQLAGRRAELGL
jgi:tRNA nucleotidyltransferase (CCA-adding enzyme)